MPNANPKLDPGVTAATTRNQKPQTTMPRRRGGQLSRVALLGLAGLVGLAACHSAPVNPADRTLTDHEHVVANYWMVNNNLDTAIRAGIISEHTLYPYDFVADSSALNPLGWRDLGVLARHYQDTHGGVLSVYRGGTASALYTRRVQAVTKALVAAGVARGQVTIVDQMPGGHGMASNTALKNLTRKSPSLGGSSGGAIAFPASAGAAMSGSGP